MDGGVSLHLPRSFHGMVTITVTVGDLYNHIVLSSELQDHATILTESSATRGYFVGEMGDWSKDGDKIDITTNSGKVGLQFEGEKPRRRLMGWQ